MREGVGPTLCNHSSDADEKRQAMIEESEKHFSRLQARIRMFLKESPKTKPEKRVNRDLDSLSLPEFRRRTRHAERGELFQVQTYADFVFKAEKQNPEVEFTKDKMDRAFEKMAEIFGKRSSARVPVAKGLYDRMIARVSTFCSLSIVD